MAVPALCRTDCAARRRQASDIAHLGTAIPKSDHNMPAVLTAAELLTNAAEHGGPVEFARIATLQAINRHAERQFNPDRKDTQWGRRKLKRDQ
jgi:hypothetical protein